MNFRLSLKQNNVTGMFPSDLESILMVEARCISSTFRRNLLPWCSQCERGENWDVFKLRLPICDYKHATVSHDVILSRISDLPD